MGLSWSCTDRLRVLPQVGAGAYRSGCTDLMLKDANDGDTGIFMRVYYPVDHNDTSPALPESSHPLWLPRKEYLDGLAGYMKQSSRRLQFLSDWLIGEKRSPSVWHVPLAGSSSTSSCLHPSSSLPTFKENNNRIPHSKSFSANQPSSFPVVVFSHGLAGCRHFYSSYCSSLASYGYVVAAIEHRDYSACWTYKLIPDSLSGRTKERQITMRLLESNDKEFKIRSQQLGKRVSECVKALHVLEELHMGTMNMHNLMEGNDFDWNQFKGRLSLPRSSVVGHSFGGATAMAATAFSTDFQAAVALDGWLFPLDADHYSRAAQPTLFINAGKWQWKENLQRMKKFGDEAERSMYTISDASHHCFSDFPLLCSSFIGRRLGLVGDTEPQILLESSVEMTVAFLRKVHEGESASSTLQQLTEQKYSSIIKEGPGMDLSKEQSSL